MGYILSLSCRDRPGLVHAVSGFIFDHGGNIAESHQFNDHQADLFLMRAEFDLARRAPDAGRLRHAFAPIADRPGMSWQLRDSEQMPRVMIMASKIPPHAGRPGGQRIPRPAAAGVPHGRRRDVLDAR
jgi:formyltetrahydrofolate deformylase